MGSCFRQVQIFPFHGHAPFQATLLEKHIIFTNGYCDTTPQKPMNLTFSALYVKQLLKNVCNSVTNHSAQSIRTICTNMPIIIIIIIIGGGGSSSSSSSRVPEQIKITKLKKY